MTKVPMPSGKYPASTKVLLWVIGLIATLIGAGGGVMLVTKPASGGQQSDIQVIETRLTVTESKVLYVEKHLEKIDDKLDILLQRTAPK